MSNRGHSPLPAANTRQDAKYTQGLSQQHNPSNDKKPALKKLVSIQCSLTQESNTISRPLPSAHSAAAPEPEEIEEPIDEAALIEARRKKREAIKAKYRGSATPLMVQALHLGDKFDHSIPDSARDDSETPLGTTSRLSVLHLADTRATASPMESAPGTPQEPGSPVFIITNDQDLANTTGDTTGSPGEDGPSAADYDPTMDTREDNQRDHNRIDKEVSSGAYDEIKQSSEQDVLIPAVISINAEPKKPKDEFDMFADEDDDDMFAEESIVAPNGNIQHRSDDAAIAVPIPQAKELDIGMLDNWDDSEGYYKIILGELLNGRYHVQANLGKGMFSGVVRATDATTNKLVAIKLIRNNETM